MANGRGAYNDNAANVADAAYDGEDAAYAPGDPAADYGLENPDRYRTFWGWDMWEPFEFSFFKAVLAEFFGTMQFLWWTTMTVVFYRIAVFVPSQEASSVAGAQLVFAEGDSATQLMIGLTFGLAISVLVYNFAGVSGGHLNPAVSVGLFVCGRISLIRGVFYILAQMVGAILGTAITKGINSSLFTQAGGACNGIGPGITNAAAVLGEAMGTAGLVFTVCRACDRQTAGNVISAFQIGLSVFLAHMALIPVTGTSINPARSFGTAVVAGIWDHQWLFWVAPITGAVFAAVLYQLLFRSPDEQKKVSPRTWRRSGSHWGDVPAV